MTTELQIQKEISPLAEEAVSIVIKDEETLKQATVILSKLNQYNDNVQEEKERITKPLNAALKAERSRWKPIETMYEDAIESIRLKMSVYQTNLVNTQKAEELAIAERIAPGKGNLSLETAIKKIEAIPKAEKEIATDSGLVQFREKQQLKITELSSIPVEYWRVDEEEILKDLKAGKIVPGAELETIQVPVNYR